MRRLLVSLILAMSASAHADTPDFSANAPDRHVVAKGDTLWDISGRFLNNPWLWPKVWDVNREAIANPHLIYPGDVIVFDRLNQRLRIERGDGSGMQTVKLSPDGRVTPLDDDAIPPVPMRAIHPFLAQPRVVDMGALDRAPFVLGNNIDEKVIFGAGDDAYATGGPEGVTRWSLLRPGQTLTDPETGEPLGVEVEYLGDARTLVEGAPQKIRVTRSVQEIKPDDKLAATDESLRFDFQPRAPQDDIRGRILAAYGGVSESGLHQTVLINRGARDGLEPGHVLAVYSEGLAVTLTRKQATQVAWASGAAGAPDQGAWLASDVRCLKEGKRASYSQSANLRDSFRNTCLTNSDANAVKLPDARSGLVMVYRVFDRVAYALIVESSGPVYLLDAVKNP